VRNALTARYEAARASQNLPAEVAQVAAATKTATATAATASAGTSAPDTAGITDAFAAAVPARSGRDNQVFHGLFVDPNQLGPSAPLVSALWSAPNTTPGTGPQQAQKLNANGMLNLFRDPAKTT
jgi:beta-glucanase (GH16 family)